MADKSIEHLLDISSEIAKPKFTFSGLNKLKPINPPLKKPKKIEAPEKKTIQNNQKKQKEAPKIQQPQPKQEKKLSKEEQIQLQIDAQRAKKYYDELANLCDFEDYINLDNEEREQIAKRLENVQDSQRKIGNNSNISQQVRDCKIKNINPFELPRESQEIQIKKKVLSNNKKLPNNQKSMSVAPESKKIRKEIPKHFTQSLKKQQHSQKKIDEVHQQQQQQIKKPKGFFIKSQKSQQKVIKSSEKQQLQEKQQQKVLEKKEQSQKKKAPPTWYCYRCEKFHDKDLHKRQQIAQQEKKQLEEQNKLQKLEEYDEEFSDEDDYDRNDGFIDDDELQDNDIGLMKLNKLKKSNKRFNYRGNRGIDSESDMEVGFDEIEEEEEYTNYVAIKEDQYELKRNQQEELREKKKKFR